jgi:hypothetical protein
MSRADRQSKIQIRFDRCLCSVSAGYSKFGRWPAMVSRLFVGVGELDHVSVVIRPAEEDEPGRQIIARKSSGHDNRWHE